MVLPATSLQREEARLGTFAASCHKHAQLRPCLHTTIRADHCTYGRRYIRTNFPQQIEATVFRVQACSAGITASRPYSGTKHLWATCAARRHKCAQLPPALRSTIRADDCTYDVVTSGRASV